MESSSGTYSGVSTQAALDKAAAELGVPPQELEHETLLGSDGEGHVLIRARARTSVPALVRVLESVLLKLGIEAEVKASSAGDTLRLDVVGSDAVDQARAHDSLERSLVHLVRRMAEKLDPGRKIELRVLLEEENRDEVAARIAQVAVQRARKYGRKVVLPPMNPYERRLVHLSIREHSEFTTESVGSGRDRRIVVVRDGG